MRNIVAMTAASVIVVLAGGGVFAFGHKLAFEEPASALPVSPPVPVVAGQVANSDVPIYFLGVGTVIAYNTVVVRSQIQGQITQIAFTEGQAVKPGDLLAQIDLRPYQAQLDQVVASRDRDQAQLTNALADLERYNKLFARGYATNQLVDTQKAQVAELQNAIRIDQALIDAAQVQLGYTRLTSPIGGVTGVRQVDDGNVIHPTDPNGLVVVTQIEPISVIFTLPESDLADVQQQMAKGPLTVIAYSQDDKTRLDVGKLDLVNNEIQQTTGTIQLKAEFPNNAHLLWPGELINVRLLLETRQGGLTVAAPAVQQGPNGSYVYVIGEDGAVQIRPVSVAQVSDGQALIDSGLAANESVVVDGQYRLQPGSRVEVLHGAAAQSADLSSAVEQAIP